MVVTFNSLLHPFYHHYHCHYLHHLIHPDPPFLLPHHHSQHHTNILLLLHHLHLHISIYDYFSFSHSSFSLKLFLHSVHLLNLQNPHRHNQSPSYLVSLFFVYHSSLRNSHCCKIYIHLNR